MNSIVEKEARSLGFDYSYIFGMEKIIEKFVTKDSPELRWFILHILHQWDTGHLRTSLLDTDDVETWFDKDTISSVTLEQLVKSIPGVISNNPKVFGENREPFVLHNNYVYINRVKKYEENFIKLLGERLSYNKGELQRPVNNGSEAVTKAVNSNFLIISGGPGTGKTTTIISILRALKDIGLTNIKLAAPTGRAAKRMNESILSQLNQGEDLPMEASTLHSLLGISPNGVKFSQKRKLNAQAVIVDEASMVDIHIMYRLFDALNPVTKLILVGDKNQLPSVEAGALLGDFLEGYTNKNHKMHDHIVVLTKSYRSQEGIRKLGELVINGDVLGVKNYLKMEKTGVNTFDLPEIDSLVQNLARNFPVTRSFNIPRNMYEEEIDSINSLFKILTDYAILTPSKRGLYGTMSLNSRLSGIFNPRGKVFYHGQPIMITKNDYINSLFNGDRGIVLGFSNGLFAFFKDDNGYKAISVSKLIDYEISYVGTVHKSQGSEFNKVAVILPKGTEKLLSREILYTALTRAKQSVDLYLEGDTIELAVNKKITRHSGIQDYLRD